VCDNPRDLEAAHAAGCQPHLVRSGRAAALDDASLAEWLAVAPETRVHADLAGFADHMLRGTADAADLDSGPMGLA
ncbi:hypothetical protein, partial [Lactiplantibacillus plantarum]